MTVEHILKPAPADLPTEPSRLTERFKSVSKSDSGSCPTAARSGLRIHFLDNLGRVTSGGRFLPVIDGLRFVAICSVILYHLNGFVVAKAVGFSEQDARQTYLFHWLHGANCGVQIFFAISGFILTLPFAREQSGGERVSIRRYFLRRLTRLEPPFLVNLALILVLLIVVKHADLGSLLGPMLATMTYTHNWVYGQLSLINGVAWSLEIEVQFYILAPILLRAYFRNTQSLRRVVLGVVMGLMILAKSLVPVEGSLALRLGLAYHLDHFLAGIFVADLFRFSWNEQPLKFWRYDILAALCLIVAFGSQQYGDLRNLLSVLTVGIMVGAMRGPIFSQWLSLQPVTVIGGMCYSIYLYHFFVISLIGRWSLSFMQGQSYFLQFVTQVLLVIPVVLIVCAVFFVLIERPFMRWRPLQWKSVV